MHSLISNRYVVSSCEHMFVLCFMQKHLAEVANLCSGDYDLILDGIHENFLQLHYHDPVMQKTVSFNYLSLSVLYWALPNVSLVQVR